jgi:hypothetical protein
MLFCSFCFLKKEKEEKKVAFLKTREEGRFPERERYKERRKVERYFGSC